MDVHPRAVLSPDFLSWTEEEGDWQTQAHDDDEDDVRSGSKHSHQHSPPTCREDDCLPDRTGGISVGVQTEVDSTSDDRTARLGRLPDGEVESTLLGRWVSDDDGGFSGPEESCRDTTESRAEQHEPRRRGHIVGIQSSAVQGVANSLEEVSVILYV